MQLHVCVTVQPTLIPYDSLDLPLLSDKRLLKNLM